MSKHSFAATLMLLLAGCAAQGSATGLPGAPPAASAIDLQSSLAKVALADLQSASSDAKAHGDKLAALCYDFLAGEIAPQNAPPAAAVAGPVSAFQRLRDFQRSVDSGLSQDFQLNCAPLLSDAQANLLKLGVVGAGAAVSGGVLPP